MFGKIVIVTSLLAVCVAELPVSGPYAPSGWRPQGQAFTLPNAAYLAPLLQPENGVVVDVTKERVVYAGQVTESNAAQVQGAYLPPGESSSVDVFRGQGLPSRFRAPFKTIRPAQLNTREFFPKRQQFQFRPFSGRFRQQQFNKQVLSPSPPLAPPATSYGVPDIQPATQYGAPDAQPAGYPDSTTDNEQNDELNDNSVVAGEYFILTPEKTLQKVSYKTFQTDDDAASNGFTAQLKYTPVEKVDGPLYKYNEQGQLVRISKK